MSHSIIPPSSAHIWGKPDGCTGWVIMAQQYPETESSQDSLEGEASHEIGADLIRGASAGRPAYAKTWEARIDSLAPNGVVYTVEHFDAAEVYAADVIATMLSLRNFDVHIEEKVSAPRVHELSDGTPDCWLYDRRTHTLYIWDYKYGFLIVEAFENWQAINYFAGIINKLGLSAEEELTLQVKVRIAQPRAHHTDGPIREWTTAGPSLAPQVETLRDNAAKALGSDATLQTGGHCRYCQARHVCAPALAAGMGLFELAARPLPVELSPAATGVQLSIIKRALKQLEGLESAFEEQVKGLLRSGKIAPGWGMQNTAGREVWTKPDGEVLALGEMLGQDLRKTGTKTPNQARKLGIDEAVIKAYSSRSSSLKLVAHDSDHARKVFAP